jgi:nitroimidazol reductase NimA-like FMN-containing flavoprotein (pyridoxamine 5'-phosphate oxidase superfamily)
MLSATPVGRLGLVVDGAPEIFPVNFVVDAGTIVFRTDPGIVLRTLAQVPSVCLEVDDIDITTATGASVLLKGEARELVAAGELAAVADLPLEFWPYGPKSHWIRIEPTEVTGRRIHRPLRNDLR